MNTTLNPRQLGTLLAALRLWQRVGERQGGPELPIATNEGEFAPLQGGEIDALCEQINLGSGSQDDATPAEIARARELYAEGSDDDIEVDDNAKASRADDGLWVQAWVWLPNEDDEGEQPAAAEVTHAAASARSPGELSHPLRTRLEGLVSVQMQDLVGDYEAPERVTEWTWVQLNASYSHRENGRDGVWEFVLNLANSLADAPQRLKDVIDNARIAGAGYLLVHQGT